MDAEQIIRELNKLPPDEQRKVLAVLTANINQTVTGEEERREQEVLERLLAKGVISEIAAPMTDAEDDACPPVEIGGEPLSEIIIRERR
jgi:SOS response regulatory protein OraA/RecX